MLGGSSWTGFLSYTSPVDTRRQLRQHPIKNDGASVQALSIALLILAVVIEQRLKREDRDARDAADGDAATAKRSNSSWLQRPMGWGESRLQYLIALGCLAGLLWLVWWRSHGDYLHFTRALAHLACSLIPIEFLVAPKPLPQSNLIMRGTALVASWLAGSAVSAARAQALLRPYHRLLGRIVICPMIGLHAVLFLAMYADFGLEYFLERLEFRHVQVGLLGLLLTATLWLTAASRKNLLTGLRGRVSKHMYCLTHLGAVMLLLAAMYFHVKQAKVYALQTLAVYGIDFVSIFSARVSRRLRKPVAATGGHRGGSARIGSGASGA